MSEQQSSSSKQPVRHGPYPEITVPAVLTGYGIGAVINVSIGYLSLMLGFSIEGSELAAILGFLVLRGILGRHSIIENNINQTLASAVNGAASGMMFSLPAIFILGYQDHLSIPLTVLGCIAGGVMGIAFIIPLRKQMIDFNRLAFPGGIATATILKSPGAGMYKAKLLLGAAVVSGAVHFLSKSTGVEDVNLGAILGMPDYMNGIWYVSLMTIGVAFLSGRGGIYFIVGGFVCYWFLAPLLSDIGLMPTAGELEGAGIAGWLRSNLFRPTGIGMLVGGALTGIVLALPLVVSAIRSMQDAAKSKANLSRDEMPIQMLYMAVLAAFVVLAVIAVTSTEEMGIGRGALMAALGTLWIWVAGVVLSECIGRTNWSPLSGMTLIGITILIFVASGMSNQATIVSSIVVGAAMCVAMSQATDLMLDLKCGYLVGGVPRKQQIAQFLGTWLGPILTISVILILHKAYTMGSDSLPAPQASALAGVIDGILGGDVPMHQYLSGAGMGSLLSLSGIGGLGVLVGLGFYLPFNIVLTYSIGTLLWFVVHYTKGSRWSDDIGVPVAAGLIVGEALVGVVYAMIVVFSA